VNFGMALPKRQYVILSKSELSEGKLLNSKLSKFKLPVLNHWSVHSDVTRAEGPMMYILWKYVDLAIVVKNVWVYLHEQ
jgi:hypothetical protein